MRLKIMANDEYDNWRDPHEFDDEMESYRHDAIMDAFLERNPPRVITINLSLNLAEGIGLETSDGEEITEYNYQIEDINVVINQFKNWLMGKWEQYVESRKSKKRRPKCSLARDDLQREKQFENLGVLDLLDEDLGNKLQIILGEKESKAKVQYHGNHV